MPLTGAGVDIVARAIANAFGGATPVPLWFGVGDSDEPFDASQTDLQGDNKIRRPMLAGYPQVSGATARFVADFEAGTGTFDLKEYGLFDAAAGGTMLCRLVVEDVGPIYPQHSYRPQISFTVNIVT